MCVCVCVRERERDRQTDRDREDGDSETLMMNDSSKSHSYFGACGMMGYTEIKLQILIAKLINLK